MTTMNRRYSGGAPQHGGIFGFIGKLLGLGPEELQKQMSDPIKQQMMMQRGGFPWALAGLSLLPMLMGKGKEDTIRNQMKTTRDPIMQRGGLSIPPALISKGLPLLKHIGIPLAMGALASVGDNVVDKVFGEGKRLDHKKRVKRLPGKARTRRVATRAVTPGVKRRRASRNIMNAERRVKQGLQDVGRRLLEKGKRRARGKVRDVGRRLLEQGIRRARGAVRDVGRRLVTQSNPSDPPFTRKLEESIQANMKTPTLSSSHIGQTFNI